MATGVRTGFSQQHGDIETCARISRSCAKDKFLQWHVKTAIRKISNQGNFLKRLEQMYAVYETYLIVRTKVEELPALPAFLSAAWI